MSNPWGIKLKKTGLNEQRFASEQKDMASLETRQAEMVKNLETDKDKLSIYSDRQASLAADATYGQQQRFGGKRNRKTKRKRTRNTKKQKKHRKSRRHIRR